MKPFVSDVNFTPSSTELLSAASGVFGTSEVQILHGHVPGAATVVKDQVKFEDNGLPFVSVTPPLPP